MSAVPERKEMSLTMTRLIMSCIMAKVTRIVPTRVDVTLAAKCIAKVVPNYAGDKAPPAANAVNFPKRECNWQ